MPEPSKPPDPADDSVTLADFLRGIPTFLSLVSIGLVVTGVVALAVALAISAVLSALPLPYDPPWDWFPDRVWHWGVTWLAVGGLSGCIGAWVGKWCIGRLEWSDGRPKLARPVLWALGTACAVLVGLALFQLARIAEEQGIEGFQRKAIAPERVCERDPELPSPASMAGVKLYDTNGNGLHDVGVDRSSRRRAFAVLIDTAENGKWPSSGFCVEGEFLSAREARDRLTQAEERR